MNGYATSDITLAQRLAAIASRPSSESLRSSSSGRHASYSHSPYSLPSQQSNEEYTHGAGLVSKFSSCSTSPNSSCESFHTVDPPSVRGSVSSNLSAAPSFSAQSRSSSRRSSRSTGSRYVDDHYPLITSIPATAKPTHASIIEMAHTYNTYIRAINSCYNNASLIDDDEATDFLFFLQTLFNILSLQLKIDQQYLVPLLHKPVLYPRVAARKTVSIHDDLTFRSSFHAWATYIHDPESRHYFSGQAIQAYMSTFAPILVQHLHDAVYWLNTLTAQGILMPEHMSKIWSRMEETRVAGLDLYTDIALLVGCHDRHFTINGHRAEQRFHQLPLGTTTMVKKWHSRRHDGAWRFCSSDFSGRRRFITA